jgi:TrmH family RNA methyltransferase
MAGEQTTGQRPLEIASTLTLIDQLQVDRRARDTHGLFFVEGVRNFVTAVDHNCAVETVVYSERLLTSPLARKLVRRLKRAGVAFAQVSPEQFRAISRADRASGVGAILRQRVEDLQRIVPGDRMCWVALSQVRSPGNFGSLVRTAAAIGAAGFILLGASVDPFDPTVVRATMGALFQQTLVRTDAEQLRRWVRQHHLQVIGAAPDGTLEYDQVRYTCPLVLVLGEERRGLSVEQRALCQQIVRIPMVAGTDSLNLAVAGSLLLYEIFRVSRRP